MLLENYTYIYSTLKARLTKCALKYYSFRM